MQIFIPTSKGIQMKVQLSLSRGPIEKLNDLKLQAVLKQKWPTVRVLNSRLMSGDQRNAEYAYITADANSGNYMINRVVIGATGLGSNTFKVEKTAPAYGDFETLYDANNALHRMDAPDTGRSTSNSPPLSSLTYYLSDFMVQAGPEIDRLLIDWRNEQTIAPLAYACYNPREDSVELQLIEASRDHRQWVKDKFFDALQELFKKVNHRMKINIPISTRENFRRESVQSISAKAPGYKTAKVNGATALVIPSDKRSAVTEISGHLKTAISFGRGYLKSKAATDKAVAKAKTAKASSAQKAAARKEAKESRTIATNNRKNAKLSLKSANAAARKHGLSGLIFSVNAETVFDPKVLKAAKSTEFGVKGKRGKFKPKFAKQSAFDNLGVKVQTPASKMAKEKAQASRAKTLAKGKVARPARADVAAAKKALKRTKKVMAKP